MRFFSIKGFSAWYDKPISYQIRQFLKALDWQKLEKSLTLRGCNNNIGNLRKLVNGLNSASDIDLKQLEHEIFKLPNNIHPRIFYYGNKSNEICRFTPENTGQRKKLEFSEICKHFNIFRMEHLGNYTGHKSYYLFGKLAEIEQALVQYAIDVLEKNGFNLISVPDILPKNVVEFCGMQTDGDRTQVYKISPGKCLSGTAEMALAGFFCNKVLKECELPIKCAAVSRCYRAETSGLNEEKGIYRVHQFTKVEMFSVCSQNQSEETLENFKDLEMDLLKNLDLNYRLLDMPPIELGVSAYQKYDIETWMPGRKIWGELSSCSNCTDYQSKRLNIKYITNSGNLLYAHTVNGTASAMPRLLISLIESNQINENIVKLPPVLLNYLKEIDVEKVQNIPEIKLIKHIKNTENE